MKRFLTLLMAIVMIFTAVPLTAFAAEDYASNNAQQSYESTMQGTNDVGNILSRAISAKEAENAESDGNGISDLTMEGKTATVRYTAPDNSTLVVAVYSEDGRKMLGSAVAKVGSDSNEIDVTLDIASFPKYYLVKAFLLDENNFAVCPEYVCNTYTEAFEQFLAKKASDFDEDLIVNFDESEDNNFAVLTDGTVKAESTQSKNIISYDESTDTYTISNADSIIKALKDGDILYLKTGDGVDDFTIISVSSVSVNGNTVTIKSEEETLEDTFQYIKIDEAKGLNENEAEQVELGSALTLSEDLEPQNIPENLQAGIDYDSALQSEEYDENLVGKDIDIDEESSHNISTKLDYEAHNFGDVIKAKISGTLGVTVVIQFKLYYDAKIFKEDYFEYKFRTIIDTSFKVTVTGSIEVPKDALKLSFPIVVGPITFKVTVYPDLAFSMNVEFKLNCQNVILQQYDPVQGEKKVQEKKHDFDVDLKGKYEIRAGIGVAIDATFAGIKALKVSLGGAFGLKFSGEIEPFEALLDSYHDCSHCFEAKVSFYVNVSFSVTVTITKKLKWSIANGKMEMNINLGYWYCSLRAAGVEHAWTKCPHKLYMVSFEIMANGEPVKNAVISLGSKCYVDLNGDGQIGADERAVTQITSDDNGKAIAYYRNGVYSATISSEGFEESKRSFRVKDDVQYIDVYLDNGSGSDTPDIPDTPDEPGEGGLSGNEKVGDHIYFGSYPQSKVTDGATLTALNGKSLNWISYGYYTGDGSYGSMEQGDWMKYADTTYNGNKYRAVKFTQYRPYWTEEPSSAGNSYQDNNGYELNTVYWFKYEPIEWRVLDPAKGLVMAETCIDSQAYSNTIYSYDGYYWNDAAHTHYASDYATSSMRKWLNDDFYNTAFNETQKSQIATTILDNTSSNSSTYDSVTTNDKVFLLSYYDVKNPAYGFSSNASDSDVARRAKSTDYAKAQGCWQSTSSDYAGNAYWFLRTPYYSYRADNVYYVGDANYDNYVSDAGLGVRPALTLNLKSEISKSKAVDRSGLVGLPQEEQLPKANLQYAALAAEPIFEFTYSNCIVGGDYIVLNVTGYGEGFELSNSNLQFIDQLTADENGKISANFEPKTKSNNSITLLIGDFGNGAETKVITQKDGGFSLATIKINNNPGIRTVNYGDGILFNITTTDMPEGAEIRWYLNGIKTDATSESAFYENAIKDIVVSVKIVDKNGNILKDAQGNEISDSEIIMVKNNFFLRLISFFKNLFKINRIIAQSIDSKKVLAK